MRMLEARAAGLPPVGTVRRRAPGYRGAFDPAPLSALWRPRPAVVSLGGSLVFEPLESRTPWAPPAERATIVRHGNRRSTGRISKAARSRPKPKPRDVPQPHWLPLEGERRASPVGVDRLGLPAPERATRGTDADLWLGFPRHLFAGFVAAAA